VQQPATAAVTGGVDTHRDFHVAAAVDGLGAELGTAAFPATRAGYDRLLRWLERFGPVGRVGVEGTGSYGAGLARHLAARGVEVVEVDRPNRQVRRQRGKSDPIDALMAAKAVVSGSARAQAKDREGVVESIRVLRVTRRSAHADRTRAVNQLRSLVSTAPEPIRRRLHDLPRAQLVRRAVSLRVSPDEGLTLDSATKVAMRELARRVRSIDAEIARVDAVLDGLVAEAAPSLLELHGVGTDTAGALLVAAGENSHRLHSEAAFAHLCGVAPIPASSGSAIRYRLNRGGDRGANSALWRIVLVRMRSHEPTRRYVERRLAEGLTKREVMRCLKRYVAREVYKHLPRGGVPRPVMTT